jgi:HAD superfamily hydrolase (TIGR01662 family)
MTGVAEYCVVVPTIGRPSLQHTIDSIAAAPGPAPREVLVVDDRPVTPQPLALEVPEEFADRIRILTTGGGRGPARARNVGWRAADPDIPWVVFVDDDVEVGPSWRTRLAADLDVPREVGGVQGVLCVPLPRDRRPTDFERNTAALASSSWITADMAYRRAALADVAGFDERFPRAFREDADLALRVRAAGWTLARGRREVLHPVRPADRWVSLRAQAGNADDARMARLHGPDWYERADAGRGRAGRHLAITACALVAAGASALRRPRLARLAAAGWLLGTLEFSAARILPGPRDRAETGAMLATSALIPPAAVAWRVRGWFEARGLGPWPGAPRAVLFDRDGTLVRDVPYNHDPEAVEPMPGAQQALDALRAAGIRVGVVSNQSGIARGLITEAEAEAVQERVEKLLGPFDVWQVCPHGPEEECACRKPRPGLIRQAAAQLGVEPEECAVIGDIGSDIEAARAAGARGVLVPTPVTLPDELGPGLSSPDLPSALKELGL